MIHSSTVAHHWPEKSHYDMHESKISFLMLYDKYLRGNSKVHGRHTTDDDDNDNDDDDTL